MTVQIGVNKSYTPSPTGVKFHKSDAFVKAVMGPVGSGKTTMCIMEIIMRATKQPAYNGVRYSKSLVIRNTLPQLVSTTLASVKYWLPETINNVPFCTYAQEMRGPLVGTVNMPLGDGTKLNHKMYFVALDDLGDLTKLKSFEVSYIWINEACELPKEVLNMATGRVRYPPNEMGGISYPGIIMDTNPPSTNSWWYNLFEKEKPKLEWDGRVIRYELFRQPPAVVKTNVNGTDIWVPNNGHTGQPKAENIDFLTNGFGYYMNQIPSQTDEWIKVFLCGDYGEIQSGKVIFPQYNDAIHLAKEKIKPIKSLPLILGHDFGVTTSATVICQYTPDGQFVVLDELHAERTGTRGYVNEVLKPFMSNNYPGMKYFVVGDPWGDAMSQTDGVTPLFVMNELGIEARKACTNSPEPRLEAVRNFLTKLVNGKPAFQLSPSCPLVRASFLTEYKYRRLRTGQINEKYSEKPDKTHPWSDLMDAVQYACLSVDESTPSGGSSSNRPAPEMRASNYVWT